MSVLVLLQSVLLMAADVIITNDSRKIDARILEVSKTEIKYKEVSNPDGPTFILSTDEISSVIYSNGTVQVFDNVPKQEESKAASSDNNVTIIPREGEAINARLIRISDEALTYESNGVEYTLFAAQLDKVVLPDGQVKAYTKSGRIGGSSSSIRNIYQNYTELSGFGGAVSVDGKDVYKAAAGGIEIADIYGYRFNQYVFLGAGIGLSAKFFKADGAMFGSLQTPLYADLRTYIPTKQVGLYPYFGLSVGPQFQFYEFSERSKLARFDTQAYFRFYTGVEYKRFVFGIGYQMNGNKSDVTHFGFVKVGIRLSKKNIY